MFERSSAVLCNAYELDESTRLKVQQLNQRIEESPEQPSQAPPPSYILPAGTSHVLLASMTPRRLANGTNTPLGAKLGDSLGELIAHITG